MAVWRVILEETDAQARRRLQAAETYLERIGEPVKLLKASKVQSLKKVCKYNFLYMTIISNVEDANKLQLSVFQNDKLSTLPNLQK